MTISDTAVNKNITVMVLAVLIIVIGTYCYISLPRESDPDITIPNVFINTTYRGVSPVDMESSVTIELEKKLKGLDRVKKIQSVSSEGNSSINIEFITGTDIDKALQDVKDKVEEAKGELPDDLDSDPSVFEINISEMPIIVFSLSGTCGLSCLKNIADDLKDEIETIAGILEVEITGGLEREIQIQVFPEKLAYYSLSIPAFQKILSSENQNTSGGAIRMGDGRYQLQVPGEFNNPNEIYNLILGTHNGEPVYLKNVALVVDSFKEENSRSRINGQEAINISVKKRAGENVLAITEEIDKLIKENQINWPRGTEIVKVMNKASDIKMMVADLENNILSGLVLVVVIIFFAMGIRNAILVSLAIPFSMLLSFTGLFLLGITLNVVVLFSLTLALGMLVDNAIVIIENIYRYMEQGVPKKQAAMRATSEVAYPVIGSTITTLAAFSPMLFWPGIMGEFMSYLPLTLIITLSSSLFVALVLNPAFASLFMKKTFKDKSLEQNKILPNDAKSGDQEKPIEIKGFLLTSYNKILNFAIQHPFIIIANSFAVLVLLFQFWMLTIGIEKPIEFFPDIDPKNMYINMDLPEGADLNYIDRIIRRIEQAAAGAPLEELFKEQPDALISKYQKTFEPKKHTTANKDTFMGPSDLGNIKNIYSKAVAIPGSSSVFSPNTPSHIVISFIDLEERNQSSPETLKEIRKRVEIIPGAKITIASEQAGPPTGAPINIEISGDKLEVSGELAKTIKSILSQIPHIKDIRDNYIQGSPVVKVIIDRQKAALFGLSTDAIGFTLKTAYNGLDISSFRDGNDTYDITLQLPEEQRRVLDSLREIMLPSPSGILVPLSTLASVEFSSSVGDIVRINDERVITVKANVDENKTTAPAARAQAEIFLENLPLPDGYKIKFTGELEEQQESQDFLSKAFMTALFLIFLILVSQFNSISQPFIIMTSVILSLGGAFLGLAIYNQPFGVIMTGVGVISLAGVVVNNAIVLIDYTNKLIERGMELKQAIISAGATRLRPVLLTATTTILGLLPMVTGISFDFRKGVISWVSESSQWWQSMAVVVIFGLVIATFLTLIVVPTLYYLFERITEITKEFIAGPKKFYWKPMIWLDKKFGQ
jgi:multidrug efflux pump